MSYLTKCGALIGCSVFASTLMLSGPAWANGQEFFEAPAGNVDLVYTGRVRDINGRFLSKAEVVIWSEELGLTFPSISDQNGHYRSPDVGSNIKEVASVVDPKGLKAACALPGYEQVRPLVIPNKAHGTIELNCVLRKAGSGGPGATAGESVRNEPTGKPTPGLFWLVPVGLVIVVIGAAARK
jgi:hypothetical protein